MGRRLALLALWAVFAVASVGVGFAAAGLVGDPLTHGVTRAEPPAIDLPLSSGPSSVPNGPTPSGGSGTPSDRPGTGTPGPTGQATDAPADRRTVTTRGGFVSATCRGGLVQVGASPTVGWEIEDIDVGRQREARVRFERTGDGDGRVEVRATCSGDGARLAVDDDGDGGGGSDDRSVSDGDGTSS